MTSSLPSASGDAETEVGKVIALWRYPVKSMGGEGLASVAVDERGLTGDRSFGIVDAVTGHLLSAKRWPRLLDAQARLRADGEVTMTLPAADGAKGAATGDTAPRPVESDDPDVATLLSAWLGREVRLARPVPDVQSAIEIEIDLDDPSRVVEFATRPGLFFDGSVLHLLTGASLEAARASHPAGHWSAGRFRPNILIDTPGEAGFVEDGWVGSTLAVGGLVAHAHKRCDRCVLVTRPVAGSPGDKEILRALHRAHGGDLGLKATVVEPGPIAVGDTVRRAC